MQIVSSVHFLSAQTLGATFNSPAISMPRMDRITFGLSWSGTPAGSLVVQGSVDGSVWVTIASIAAITMAGAGDTALIDMATGCPYIRLSYTRSGGTGSLDVYYSQKEV